ncbi:MAG: GNAT family N-acetyltransferase [Deltaproteobacteria bacterium]|uniref:GNAT family N-acetyltransferase n=1 Tax=Desulfobacula sp. TaxID=2593537 RepID=UPI0019BDC762|nr:GNAT family N-acetyltransferase [Candidatus Desulfobacula maris]MBL6992297.1 GNAT family N-acetyltransferase [Desulfobacula sp.]
MAFIYKNKVREHHRKIKSLTENIEDPIVNACLADLNNKSMKSDKNIVKPPSLTGRDFVLSPLKEEHVKYLWSWENDITESNLWAPTRGLYSELEFHSLIMDRIENFYHEIFIILKPDGTPVGTVYSYKKSMLNGFAYFAVYIVPWFRKKLIGTNACIMFIHYLFSFFPFRRILSKVLEYNHNSFSCIKNAGFQIEGKLKDHVYYNGGYHTMILLAIFREDFYSTFGSMINQIVKRHGISP